MVRFLLVLKEDMSVFRSSNKMVHGTSAQVERIICLSIVPGPDAVLHIRPSVYIIAAFYLVCRFIEAVNSYKKSSCQCI